MFRSSSMFSRTIQLALAKQKLTGQRKRDPSKPESLAYQLLEPRKMLSGSSLPSPGNLITNGDFEQTNQTAWRHDYLSYDVDGWRAYNASDPIEIFRNGSQSNFSLNLNANRNKQDRIYSEVKTDFGQTYLFSFDLRTVNDQSSRPLVQLMWDNQSAGIFLPSEDWQTYSIELKGVRTGQTILELRETAGSVINNGSDTKTLIDNVRLTPVTQVPIVNGSFEKGPVNPDNALHKWSDIPGWNGIQDEQSDGQIRVRRGGPYVPDGQYYWTLDSSDQTLDRIYQDIATRSGSSYVLMFDMRAEDTSSGSTNQLRVRWNNQHVASISGTEHWQTHSVYLSAADAESARLVLREPVHGENGLGDGLGPWIDNIRIFEVDDLTTVVDTGKPLPVIDLDADDSSTNGSDYIAIFDPRRESSPVVGIDAVLRANQSGFFESLTVTLTNARDVGFESLIAVSLDSNLTARFADNILTITGRGTAAQYQRILQTIAYSNRAKSPDITPREIQFSLLDTSGRTHHASASITIAPSFPAGQIQLFDSIPFVGKSPVISQSSSFVVFDLTRQTFDWNSVDPVLGKIGVNDVPYTGRLSGSNPVRLVFEGTSTGGVAFEGQVLFDPTNRAVIDVTRNNSTVRYLLTDAPIPDQDPPPCPTCSSQPGVSVLQYNGASQLSSVDFEIPGRGINWKFERTYRSDVSFDGTSGRNWETNYSRRLRVVNENNLAEIQFTYPNAKVGDIVHNDGQNRADLYLQGGLTTPDGFYTNLAENPDGSFTERLNDGTIIKYAVPTFDGLAPMTNWTDRDGNTLTFQFDANNRLERVIDDLGRPIEYIYDSSGLLTEIQDFDNRSIRFEYDENGDLVAVTTPAVTGTPTGNDFPDGKTERYTYTTGSLDSRQNHKLVSVTAANEVAGGGPPRIVNTYDPNPPEPHLGRVLMQSIGGINHSDVPSGGNIIYVYQDLDRPTDPDDVTTATRQTTVTDRNGNVTELQFNQLNNLVRQRVFTNRDFRASDPEFYETRYVWNTDYELLQTIYPQGNIDERILDSDNPDRFQQGNLLEYIQNADARGGDQQRIATTYTYEPIYNNVRTSVDPRGNDPDYIPQNGGANSPERYTSVYTYDFQEGREFTALAAQIGITVQEVQQLLLDANIPVGLGDINGDGITNQIAGKLVRIESPTVNLLPGSNQSLIEGDLTQEIVWLFTYNQFGQITRGVDAEANVTVYEYFPENDPDGDGVPSPPPLDGRVLDTMTGGYLKQVFHDTESNPIRNSQTDPTPTNIRTQYAYDDVGNVIREVDGRGIATDYFVNQLNQVVQTVRAAEHDVFVADPIEPVPLTDFQYIDRVFYDFNNNIILSQVEDRGNTSGVDGNPLDDDLPTIFMLDSGESTGSNTSTTLVDTNQQWVIDQWTDRLIKITGGTGVGQVRTITANTGSVLTVESDWKVIPDNSSSYSILPNPDPVGGTAFVDRVFEYDILNNLLETIEEVANGNDPHFLRTRFRYDPNEHQVLTILPEGNATTAIFDERDLLFQSTRGALGPPEDTLPKKTIPAPTLFGPDDPFDYDVRGGIFCQCTTNHYDLNGNLIETVDAADTDGSTDNNSDLGGPGDRTRFIYDGFDRLTSVIDAVGNQTVTQYDPASNVVRTLSFGPVGGPSPTSDGPDVLLFPVSEFGVIQSANLVNSNLLRASESNYDELNRVFQTDAVLFVNTIPTVRPPDVADGATDLGKGNLTPGDNQAIAGVAGVSIIGRVSSRTEFDRNSRTTFTVEDDVDTRRFFYDGVHRVIKTADPEGNIVETAYDDNSNVIEMRETDVAQVAGVADELFLTTYFYDTLNRTERVVDNIGQTTFYRYDSRNNLVAFADAQGPLTGATISRRAFPDGPLTVNTINDFGNVTRYFFDGIGRQTRREVTLTQLPEEVSGTSTGGNTANTLNDNTAPFGDHATPNQLVAITAGTGAGQSRAIVSNTETQLVVATDWDTIPDATSEYRVTSGTAAGDGIHVGASVFGVKDEVSAPESFTSTPDLNQGGGDGLIRTGQTYDDNSLTSALLDDQGNITLYLYDNLNRRVTETKGLVVTSPFTEQLILGNRRVITPTVATLNDPAFIPESQIQTQMDAAAGRVAAIASLFPPLGDDVSNPPPPPQPTTIVSGYDQEDNLLILEDENDSEVFTKYDAINRAIAVRVFRSQGNPGPSFQTANAVPRPPDSHVGDPNFAPDPMDDFRGTPRGTFPAIIGTNKQDYHYDGLSRLVFATDNNHPDLTVDSPRSVTTGDFNGDGVTDLATANNYSDNVSVLLGDGDGTFAAQQNFAAGDFPVSVTTGDFNGDGVTDLATANAFSDNVSVLLGDGDGTFAAPQNFAAGDFPVSVTTGDFNGDGVTDLATANAISNNVSVLLGNGDGTFAAPQNFAAGNDPFSVTAGDFNGDGLLDLATANAFSDNVSVLLGDGDGTFAAPQNFAAGDSPVSVTTGDFNGDGVTDLATANNYSDNVSVLLGDGDGTFAAPQNFAAGDFPQSVTTGDFNGDGVTDLATANAFSDNVSVLLGDGDGTFAAPQNFAAGDFPQSVTTGDFNGDGVTDLATANRNSDNVSVLLGNGDGTFENFATDDDSAITYAYDSLSRVIEETQTIGALDAKAISTAWRAENLRSGLTYPNDRQLEFTYDNLDRLNTIADTAAPLAIADYDYIGTSRVLIRAYPQNGTRMTWLDDAGTTDVGYDGLRRATQLRHLRSDNSLIVGFGHTYDRTDNKLDEAKLHDPTNDESYTYDSAYRLTNFDRIVVGAIGPEHSNFTLDGAGNWTQVDGETREHSSFNEITLRDDGGVTTLTYDDNGNSTDDGTHRYEWDALNRLREVTRKSDGALIASYAYDATGRRISKVVSNSGALDGVTAYYLDGQREIEERNGTDVLLQQYVFGNYIDETLVLDRNLNGDGTAIGPGDQRLFYHQNTQFSTFALTDGLQRIVEGYLYDAYGKQTVYTPGANGVVDFGSDDIITVGGASALANPYLFTGRRLDAETDLYYYRTRYLDTRSGRFTTRDTIGVWGDANNRGNGYAYVGNSPWSALDPMGKGTIKHCNDGTTILCNPEPDPGGGMNDCEYKCSGNGGLAGINTRPRDGGFLGGEDIILGMMPGGGGGRFLGGEDTSILHDFVTPPTGIKPGSGNGGVYESPGSKAHCRRYPWHPICSGGGFLTGDLAAHSSQVREMEARGQMLVVHSSQFSMSRQWVYKT